MMFRRHAIFFVVICASAPLWAETDSVSVRIPPDQAVFVVRYQPEGDLYLDQVMDARKLHTQVSEEILSLQKDDLIVDLYDFQPSPHEKLSSSSSRTQFTCKVMIALATDTADRFWRNSQAIAQVMIGLSNLSKKVKGLSWEPPEYVLKEPERLLPRLHRLVRQRIQMASSNLFNPSGPNQVMIEPYALKVAGRNLSSVTVELPFRLGLTVGKPGNGP
jgi:hypothetical protein